MATATPVAPVAVPTDRALTVIEKHAEHASAFLALNDETSHFFAPGIDGVIAYRDAGRAHTVQLCGPIAAAGDREPLLRAFLDDAKRRGRRVTAVELLSDDLELYAAHGFRCNQLGSSYSIDLSGYSLRGSRFLKLRNKINRARKYDVLVEEISPERLEEPAVEAELASIDAQWLRSKGRLAKQLTFLVGERAGRGRAQRRLFVARRADQPIAYVTYSPVFGSREGWLYDLTRRVPDAPPGTIELVFATVASELRERNCGWLHLGLTPLVGLAPKHEPADAGPLVTRFATFLGEHGEHIYPARDQEAFKVKWNPQAIEPEYAAFQDGASFGAIWQLLRLTRAI